jgi:phosphatidylinositol 3-kinase
MDVSEALKLLSGGKAFQSPIVRSYAVDVLRTASDQELQVLLLQLVQALRYEPIIMPANQRSDEENFSPNTIDTTSENVEQTEISQDEVKIDGFEDIEKISTVPSLTSLSPLGRFLVTRACTSTIRKSSLAIQNLTLSVANYFYWFLKVEIQDSYLGEMFQNVFNVFMYELSASNEAGRLMERKLRALNEYIDTISR